MIHRGPDSAGEYFGSHVGLVMRRLSVIDVEHGAQPLFNESGSLVLIANGEIYNAPELRTALARRGHCFATGSDCESILHLYEECGQECVTSLRGMFAFALWDLARNRLLLARDRMGEKPLYLHESENGLIFASEMKALISSGLVPFELDPNGVDLFLHYQYVPEPFTAVKGVRKLDAASIITLSLNDWSVIEKKYWRMEDAAPLRGDPVPLIRERLDEVGELVVRSDVPVGVALSGGLDSSIIAALAAKKYPGTVHAFSVGYPGRPEYDERAAAKRLADHLAIPFHEAELTTSEMVSAFPKMNQWRDDPIADISGFGYYMVMRLAHECKVPVVLQGQGADELFWGYDWVRKSASQSWRKDHLLRLGAIGIVDYLRPSLPEGPHPWQVRLWMRDWCGVRPRWQEYCRDRRAALDQFVFYDLVAEYKDLDDLAHWLYTDSFRERCSMVSSKVFSMPRPWPDIGVAVTRLICDTYLRCNGVAQGDRLGMASSIELRLPFLDYRLVETVIGLRKMNRDHCLGPKAWLRAAGAPLLPEWALHRPKRGFAPPVREWQKALFSAYGKTVEDGVLTNADIISSQRWVSISKNPVRYESLMFKLLVLEMWSRSMMDLSSGERET